jgi:hypothetical protein
MIIVLSILLSVSLFYNYRLHKTLTNAAACFQAQERELQRLLEENKRLWKAVGGAAVESLEQSAEISQLKSHSIFVIRD